MLIEQIQLKNGCAIGLRIDLQKYPLLLIRAEKGFLMCGYLDIKASEALGDVAAKVKGVQSFENMLEARLAEVSSAARELGIEPGITGREALEKMF